jgi:murein DD-endopeptidase MepM/ murein hydrolase activator NlpD
MMRQINSFLRKAFTPITIMLIPHDNLSSINLRIPLAGLFLSGLLAIIGVGYVFSLAVNGLHYKDQHQIMASRIKFYSERFSQWNTTLSSLHTAERDFHKIFSLQSKEEVLKNVDYLFAGSIDIPDLTRELEKTIETVDEIKSYLRTQKDIYVATPEGYPVSGRITSGYGERSDPMSGEPAFHSGIDLSCSYGSEIRATADGVVSHSGWKSGCGNTVVLEHGCGFSTIYAHNKMNAVKVGALVHRGDIIGYVGSTGKSTGPHVHYEVWKDRKSINPYSYLIGEHNARKGRG